MVVPQLQVHNHVGFYVVRSLVRYNVELYQNPTCFVCVFVEQWALHTPRVGEFWHQWHDAMALFRSFTTAPADYCRSSHHTGRLTIILVIEWGSEFSCEMIACILFRYFGSLVIFDTMRPRVPAPSWAGVNCDGYVYVGEDYCTPYSFNLNTSLIY